MLIVVALAPVSKARGQSADFSGELIIFHAGSLSVPLRQICRDFGREYPNVKVLCEAAGSRMCARKITELDRRCDVIASADYTVIDNLLIPSYASWNIKFAGNEMVIAFGADSNREDLINKNNWRDILLTDDVIFGRSDPNSDPCGYRAVLVIKLAEKLYARPGLAAEMLAKDKRYIRPKETDLLALLQVGVLDYIFIYRSVAEQHALRYLLLPDRINLKETELTDFYKSASVCVTGKKPGSFVIKAGSPIVYGVTIPNNAPNPEAALEFLKFLLDAERGGATLEKNGQNFIVPSPTDTFEKLPESLKSFAFPAEQETKK